MGHLRRQFIIGQQRNIPQVVLWVEKSAKAGAPEAQYALAHMQQNGFQDNGLDVVMRDTAKALYWYRLAAEHTCRCTEHARKKVAELRKADSASP